MTDHTDYRIPVLLAIPLCFILYWTLMDNGFIYQRKEVQKKTGIKITLESDGSPAGEALISVFQLRKIPVNTADTVLLQTISGIGPKLAQKIVDERNRSGPFTSAEDLARVPGIGHKRISQFQENLRFD